MNYWGLHPTGRRFYVQPKRPGTRLAFAVFVRDVRYPIDSRAGRWERRAVIEDRPYQNELHRVDGIYVPYPGDMPPHVKAEEHATWYREVVGSNCEARIVELHATKAVTP